jgi:cytidylate kinase
VIITIDGPSGSGKSTTARAVADRLGYLYLDTGAMYRAVALAFIRAGAEPTSEAAVDLLPDVRVDIRYDDDAMRVHLNGEDVTEAVRAQSVGTMASRVSQLAAVREKLVWEQRRIAAERVAAEGGVVLDGRDMGTVVFPDADVKIFMVADARVRAERRHAEYVAQGRDVPLDAVHEEIIERDRQDQNRELSPLQQADDAVELDTTNRSIDEQVEFVVDLVRSASTQGTNP